MATAKGLTMECMSISGGRANGSGAALFMQGLESATDFETDPLTAFARSEVRHVGLRYPNRSSNLMLRHATFQEVGNEVFPHGTYNSICCCGSQQHLALKQQPLVQHLLSRGYFGDMKPEEIRRQRLRQWIDSDPASLGDVEAWCTHYSKFVDEGEATLSPTYIRQLVPKRGSAARNIGERTARRLERIGRKPRGWLDQEDSDETDMLYPATDTAQPKGTAEALSDSYAKALQLETLRRSVKAIAAAFGVSPADLVSDDPEVRREIDAALGLATGAQAITIDDEVEQEQLGQTPPGTVLPRARPTMEEETADYPAEVDPAWQEEDTPRQQPAHKDRRA